MDRDERLLIIVLLGLSAFCSSMSDVFLSWPNLINILTASSTLGLLAIGAAFVIGAGGLDLSVGSIMAFSACLSAFLINVEAPSALYIIVSCLLCGVATGAVSGMLIGFLKLPAFIATLAMLSLARGAALVLSNGRPTYGLPSAVVFVGQGSVLGITIPTIIFFSVALLAQLILTRTSFGWHCLAIGDNERAARDAGIRIVANKCALYAFSGFLAALAGLLYMGRVNAADPNAGLTYELTAITAAVIGGTKLSGGRASVMGAVLGALIMGVLQNALTLLNVSAYYQQVAVGAILLIAVSFGQWRSINVTKD
jgi:ribose/xylose/arabinose/galactoside ABC-type transport system permease subunit